MINATARPDVLARARELQASGASLNAIARVLQAEKYPTLRGGSWYAQQVKNLFNSRRPSSAFLVPCTACGRLTSSKYGICHRPPCRRAYVNLSREILKPRVPTVPCESCGRPTRSALLPVCGRLSCRNERMRLVRADQKGTTSVYAVWFPVPCILKIGFSSSTADTVFESSARVRAKNRDWDIKGSRCIWKQPGDMRTEAWMQATLAFRWHPAFSQKYSRICEWFSVPAILVVDEVVAVLAGIYRLVPADLRGEMASLL